MRGFIAYMPKLIENAVNMALPVVALNGIVPFPGEVLSIEIHPDSFNSPDAFRIAANGTGYLLLVTIVPKDDDSSEDKLFDVGVVSKIKQYISTSDGRIKMIAETFSRASITSYSKADNNSFCMADVISKTVTLEDEDKEYSEAYIREMIDLAADIAKNSSVPMGYHITSAITTAKSIKNPAQLADFMASHAFREISDKLDILSLFDPQERMNKALEIMKHERNIAVFGAQLNEMTRDRMDEKQRRYFLREQMSVIEDELGYNDGDSSETEDYEDALDSLEAPQEVKDKLFKDYNRLRKLRYGSSEANLLSEYLDTCLSLPWSSSTEDNNSVEKARQVLDADHEGLEEVKQRLLEFLAVKQLNPSLKGHILCLYGPPGVGKTSIASSLANAMGRKFVRISLGGVNDEADIRGHRKTYIGAMPGRIINALISSESKNPLILLDEIDKIGRDHRGDPADALLEALDPEQNKGFRDHYIEFPFDLSDCIFIATANTLETVPRPLIDRMEIIEIHTYTKSEKMAIARNHLIPRLLHLHGLDVHTVNISDGALSDIIDFYTNEAGVRNLERELSRLCRRLAMSALEDKGINNLLMLKKAFPKIDPNKARTFMKRKGWKLKPLNVTAKNLEKLLGPKKFLPESIYDSDGVGVVNGLAYTQTGGDVLKIEVAVTDGTGKLELTGSLGDVMKESAKTALTYVRSIAHEYNIPSDFYQKHDIHIHAPEGAVPKDGPSAGVTMLTALLSALTKIPVRHDVAMTGEITLLGRVLAIGGLREKTMAAYRAGVKTVLIPYDNLKDIDKLDKLVQKELTIIPCKTVSDVISHALVQTDTKDSTPASDM